MQLIDESQKEAEIVLPNTGLSKTAQYHHIATGSIMEA